MLTKCSELSGKTLWCPFCLDTEPCGEKAKPPKFKKQIVKQSLRVINYTTNSLLKSIFLHKFCFKSFRNSKIFIRFRFKHDNWDALIDKVTKVKKSRPCVLFSPRNKNAAHV